MEFHYEVDGMRTPVRDVARGLDASVFDLDYLPFSVMQGFNAPRGYLPFGGVKFAAVDEGQPLTSLDLHAPESGIPLRRLATDFAATLRHSILRQMALHSARSIGVCISGGLDSALILAVCADLRRQGQIEELVGFHYTWSDVPEMRREEDVAARMCADRGVALTMIESGGVSIDCLLDTYQGLPFPHFLTFHHQLLAAARRARDLGIELLLTGVGSELHTVSTTSAGHLDRTIRLGAPLPTQRQELTADFLPFWLSLAAAKQHAAEKHSVSSPVDAIERARLDEYSSVCTVHAAEQLAYAASDCDWDLPALAYPYLDPRFVIEASRTGFDSHLLRHAGEIYDKAILRMALSTCSPREVFLRSGGSPLQCVEQNYLRKDWQFVEDFWRQPSALDRLGIIDANAIRAAIASPRQLLVTSDFLLPTMLIENWLRTHA
ncbi:MAG: asparagine synthase-related protein [Rhodococcus sp. (in: high G+C Gram-positive bacteria)]|uniref:asparagine synthase-related protein n=1 Tax=Rhodococcus sp. TaxID=1831 RepID=UPI002ADAA4B1|nr:asparagine synthase-related protein [Rhodococcus sp. (in: high G+C Gram-positive bacteria)]